MRNRQLTRSLELLKELDNPAGRDIYELADRFGTGTRTILRDLAALQEAHIPLVHDADGRRNRWRVDFNYPVQNLTDRLNRTHFAALLLAMNRAKGLKGTPVYDRLLEVAEQLDDSLSKTSRGLLTKLRKVVWTGGQYPYLEAPPDHFWHLVDAAVEGKLCKLVYTSVGHALSKPHIVLPLRLFWFQEALYLSAWSPGGKHTVTFNLHRLKKVTVLNKKCAVPAGAEKQQEDNSVFGIFSGGKPTHYHIRFDATVAPYIRERQWHPSQKIKSLKDGGAELEFRCPETLEVSAWVASWREHAEALGPKSLRDELYELGQRWIEVYR